MQSRKDKGLNALLRELSDNEEDTTMDTGLNVLDDPQRPWIRDYHAYMDVPEQVPEGWTAIQWWGVSTSASISWCKTKIICSTIHNAIIQPGAPLHETTWQSCHHLCQVSAHSRRVGSQYQNAAIVSRVTLWRPYSVSSVLSAIIYSFENPPHLQY